MIELTDEMRAAFRAERDDWCNEVGCGRDDCLDERLAAVLAIVERDNHVLPQRQPIACSSCGGIAAELPAFTNACCGFDRIQPVFAPDPGICLCRPGEGRHEFGVEGCQGYAS